MKKIIVNEDQEMELTHVEGDLYAKDGATIIIPENVKELVIEGNFVSNGDVTVKGDISCNKLKHDSGILEIEGNVNASQVKVSSRRMRNGSLLLITGSLNSSEVHIDGKLEVEHDCICDVAEINGSCSISGNARILHYEVNGSAKHGGNLEVDDLEVNGSLKSEGNIHAKGDVEVNGSCKVAGTLAAIEIEVGGALLCDNINARTVEVGGSTKISSGKITERLDVGGAFKCSNALEGSEITCNGSCSFGEGTNIDKLTINGSTSVGDNFQFADVSVNGSFKYSNNATGNILRVNGSCVGQGTLKLQEELLVNGSITAENVEAKDITIKGTANGSEFVAETILIGKDSRANGIFRATKVIVEKRAKVEQIIAKEVVLEEKAKVKKIEAEDIQADPSAKFETE